MVAHIAFMDCQIGYHQRILKNKIRIFSNRFTNS